MLVVAALLFATQITDQVRPDSIIGGSNCSRCRIVLSRPTHIGAKRDTAGRYADTQVIVRSNGGELYVPKVTFRDRLAVYDNAGGFLRTERFDSLGEGNIGAIYRGLGDTTFVFNNARTQLVAVLPSTKSIIPLLGYPGSVHQALRMKDGSWIVNGVFRTSETIGQPIHILSREGAVRSFGSISREHRPDRPLEGWRHLAMLPSGNVLAASYTQPVLEVWSTSATRIAQFHLQLPEFVIWDAGPRWSEMSPPRSVIDDARVDEQGRVWLMVSVAGKSWRQAMRTVITPDGPVTLPSDWTKAISSWLLIVEPNSGKVIFGARFNNYLRQFLGTGQVIGLSGAPNENQTLTVFALDADLGLVKERGG